MSKEPLLDCKFGSTGHVEIYKKIVKKYSEFNSLYWLKEHAIFMFTWPFKTDNIIKYDCSYITEKKCPEKHSIKRYYETILKRYPNTLYELRLYRDHEIIQFLLDISSALIFLHKHDIYHRDIKPANIVMSTSGRATLIDFSHAHRMIIPLNQLDAQVVTYYYRSPEVFAYQNTKNTLYDKSIDIYSVGMVLLEILTGEPFAQHYNQFIKKHVDFEDEYGLLLQDETKALNAIKSFFVSYKRSFKHIDQYWQWILKMIAHKAKDRFSADELFEAVKNFADTNKIQYIMPENGMLAVNVPKLNNPVYEVDEILFNKCTQYVCEIKKKHNMFLNPSTIHDLIKFLIGEKIVNDTNYKEQMAAIAIIITTVIFDDVTVLKNYDELNCQAVINAIISIVSNYDRHLFGYNAIFKFNV